MEEISTFIDSNLVLHWPFFAAMVIFMISGQVMISNVFIRTAHQKHKPVWFWWWGRKTLALQPIILGLVLGVIWRNPEPGVDTLPDCMGYFALAGGLSVWAYEFLKGIMKKKGINLDLPGIDSIAPIAPIAPAAAAPPPLSPLSPSFDDDNTPSSKPITLDKS